MHDNIRSAASTIDVDSIPLGPDTGLINAGDIVALLSETRRPHAWLRRQLLRAGAIEEIDFIHRPRPEGAESSEKRWIYLSRITAEALLYVMSVDPKRKLFSLTLRASERRRTRPQPDPNEAGSHLSAKK